jgi:hypothetical protein
MTDTETKGTNYVVFAATVGEDGGVNALSAIDDATALNDTKAIKIAVGALAGQYVAIPVRNLKVRTVTVESEPKVTIA